MAGHADGDVALRSRRLVGRHRVDAARRATSSARSSRTMRWRRSATRAPAPATRADRRGARPVAHVLRTRPRPHPARQRVPPPGRQDPGVRVPRRPPAHPPHPRARGRAGGHVGRPGARASTWRSPRRSRSVTTAVTGRAGTPARTRSRPYVDGGYDHAVWGADVTLTPLNLCVETLDGIRNHSWSRPAPATPEGEVVSVGRPHRLRVPRLRGRRRRRRSSAPTMLPAIVRERCGERRSAAARRVHRTR